MTNISSFTFAVILAAFASAQESLIAVSEPGLDDFVIERPIDPQLPGPRETHQCDIPEKDCDWGYEYWNGLACECHVEAHCKKLCLEGQSLYPLENCLCSENERIRTHYPDWATDADIDLARQDGLNFARARPDNWRQCPRKELKPGTCESGWYWNELACECFPTFMCMIWCGDGYVNDPKSGCGCITAQEARNIYPKWATPLDIYNSNQEGFDNIVGSEEWRVCPYYDHVTDCPVGEYWNELACQCFKMASCRIGCREGTQLSPLSTCNCVDSEELRAKLYPDWATDDDIRSANEAGWANYKNPDGIWPTCDVECSDDFYLNELACKCFSTVKYCFVPCEVMSMPTSHCGCTEDKADYYALFPHWATDEMIDRSQYEGMKLWENTPRRPAKWPECPSKSNTGCNLFNELACSCFSEIFCTLACPDGQLLDPRYGCSCITQEEARAIYPDWASDKDIKMAGKLMWNDDNRIIDPVPAPIVEEPLLEIPEDWPACNTFVPCPDPQVLNVLACNCFSIIQCEIWCGEDSTVDPVDGCTCISNEKARGYYPEWASEKDIDISQRIMWQTYDNQQSSWDNNFEDSINNKDDGSIQDLVNDLFGNDGANHFSTTAFLTSTALVGLTVNVF